jgi:hypothetical protein
MIRPLPSYAARALEGAPAPRRRPFPTLDRAFDAVERALGSLGTPDPASLRSPRLVEELLSPTALPGGTLLVVDPDEIRAAEEDIEDTVRDERLGGAVFLSLPPGDVVTGERLREIREIAAVAPAFVFNPGLKPIPSQRLGKARQVPTSLDLRGYRFVLADTPGFRVALVRRACAGGGEVALWTGDPVAVAEVRATLATAAVAAGYPVPPVAGDVPRLEGITEVDDVWRQAEMLRAHRSVRDAELRQIARQAALRGVAIRRERERERRTIA